MKKFLYNAKQYVIGYTRYLLHKHLSYVPQHILEQVKYRAKACEPCLIQGSCVNCSCKTPALFYADKACSNRNYGVMLNRAKFSLSNIVECPSCSHKNLITYPKCNECGTNLSRHQMDMQ